MRIVLFIAMQLAVLLVVSVILFIILPLFGIRLTPTTYGGLLLLCAVMGFSGSLISLFLSKWMCKKAYGVQVITTPRNEREAFLLNTVASLAQRQNLGMPEVGVYQSRDPNAFATGASRNSALVAVSSALLYSMNEDELRGVLGHEMSHVGNGDMVTMTLLQGVLNTFVYFFSYLAALAVSNAMNRSTDSEGRSNSIGNVMAFHLANTVFQIIFGILANMILMWYSRHREYRADAGSAALEGKKCMIKALQALRRATAPAQQPGQFQAFCINGGGSVAELFMSHPTLEKRIAALQKLPS